MNLGFNSGGMNRRRFLAVLSVVVLVTVFVAAGSTVRHRTRHAKMQKALAEIRGAEQAISYVLLGRAEGPRQLFTDAASLDRPTFEDSVKLHTSICYELLKKGGNAQVGLKSSMLENLPAYYNLPKDPWGHDYQFYFGPIRNCPVNKRPFRCYRGRSYVYDMAAYTAEMVRMPNCPKPETDSPPAKGFPCPDDLPIYIYSLGANGKPDQLPLGGDGGDDVNNWDTDAGWSCFY